jgi:hypothetical protein
LVVGGGDGGGGGWWGCWLVVAMVVAMVLLGNSRIPSQLCELASVSVPMVPMMPAEVNI